MDAKKTASFRKYAPKSAKTASFKKYAEGEPVPSGFPFGEPLQKKTQRTNYTPYIGTAEEYTAAKQSNTLSPGAAAVRDSSTNVSPSLHVSPQNEIHAAKSRAKREIYSGAKDAVRTARPIDTAKAMYAAKPGDTGTYKAVPADFDAEEYKAVRRMMTYDFDAELKMLEEKRKQLEQKRQTQGYMNPSRYELLSEIEALDKQISALNAERSAAKTYRTMQEYYALQNKPDFESVSASDQYKDTNVYQSVFGSTGDLSKDMLNRARREEYDRIAETYGDASEEAKQYLLTYLDNGVRPTAENVHTLTDEEKRIFNYILNTDGEDAAVDYLTFMQDTMNQRAALENYARLEKIQNESKGAFGWLNEHVSPVIHSAYTGGETAERGFAGLFSNDTSVSKSEYLNAVLREDAGAVQRFAMDAAQAVGNMVPSAAVGVINPTAGRVLLGLTAGGNAKREALRMGYTQEQAAAYGVLVGVSEATLEKLLGGIQSLSGGKGVHSKIENVLFKLGLKNQTAARALHTYLGNMADEFAEEYLQEILEPVFRNICLDENNEFKLFSEDALYSGLLGAINAAVLNLPYIPDMRAAAREASYQNIYDHIIGRHDNGKDSAGASQSARQSGFSDASGITSKEVADTLTQSGLDAGTAEKIAPDLQSAIIRVSEKAADNAEENGQPTYGTAQVSQSSTKADDILRKAAEEKIAEMERAASPVQGQAQAIPALRSLAWEMADERGEIDAANPEISAQERDLFMDTSENAQRMQNAAESKIGDVKAFAERLGNAGRDVFVSMYDPDMDSAAYLEGMTAYYEAGKNGVDFDRVKGNADALNSLISQMRKAAYVAGQSDAATEQKSLALETNSGYTGNTYDAVEAALQTQNRYEADGYTFRLTHTSGGWLASIDAADANGIHLQLGAFPNREAAADAIVNRAKLRSLFNESEEMNGGTESISEIYDRERVLEPAENRENVGGLLDGVSPENVQKEESGWDAAERTGGRGTSPVRSSGQTDAEGLSIRRGAGSGERRTLQPFAGEISQKYGLTEDEVGAILSYKSSESYTINAKLRGGEPLSEQEQKFVDNLDSALEKLPLYKGKIYRNLSFFEKEEFDTFVAQHIEGLPVYYDAYTSASTKHDGYTVDGAYIVHIIIPNSGSAHDANGFGNNFENEVICPRNSKFVVDNVYFDESGTPTITLREGKYDEARNDGQLYSEKQSDAVRDVQESHPVHVDVQGVSEGNTGRNSGRESNLQGTHSERSTEVTEQAPVKAETAAEQSAQKSELATQETERVLDAAEDEDDTDMLLDDEEDDVERAKNVNVSYPDDWTAERVGDPNKTPKPLSDIIENIRHDFGIHITVGAVKRGARGQYNRHEDGIRTKIANDLVTVSHELGHRLDKLYDLRNNLSEKLRKELKNGLSEEMRAAYPKEKHVSEGIAEYIRKFLKNSEQAAIEYPNFTAFFKKTLSPKDLALIEQLADEVNAYLSLDADTATSSVRLREDKLPDARTYGEKIKDISDAMYQSWTDSLHGIKRFDEAIGADTYKIATNSAYADAIAGAIIAGDLTDADGRFVSGGLKEALHGINLKDKKEYMLFGEYLTVRHGPERLKEGMRVFADDKKNTESFMNRRRAELEAAYPGRFAEAAERLYRFQKQFLQTWGVDTGLVSRESADAWAERWEYYVPLNRAIPKSRFGGVKRGFANQNSTIHHAKGSGLDVIHPVDNIIANITKMVTAGVRNNVMRLITDSAIRLGGNADFMEKVPPPVKVTIMDMTGVKTKLNDEILSADMDASGKEVMFGIVAGIDDVLKQYGEGKAHGDTIAVLKNGKPEYWKINDPLLLESLVNMAPTQMNGILDAYAVVSRFMTSNITGNNLIWSIFSNLPRDMMTFFTYSKEKNPFRAFPAFGSAYVNKIKGDRADPLYKEFLAMGGGNMSAYSADRDLAKKARARLSGKRSYNPLDLIAYIGDLIETGPRFATYKLMRQNGMTPKEAFYEAMDITVNFRRGGIHAREVNKAVPFFNANVQGLDKFARWITAAEAPRGKARLKAIRSRMIQYIVVSAALAALIYGLNNSDEEKEKEYEQLSNYTKNSYWNIPLGDGKYFAIPKPREIGVLSSFFETCMEYGIGENDHAFDEFYEYAVGNFLPSIASDLAIGDWEGVIGSVGLFGIASYVMANRDFLGRPIESAGMQNLEPKSRYTDRTSKIAYWIGQAFNQSPVMIDYFFTQTLGGWWKAQKALFPVGGESVDYTLGIQNTYIKDNQYSTDLVNWMYDKAEKSKQKHNSAPEDVEKAITFKLDSNMTSFYSKYNSLAKNTNANGTAERGTRQVVLDMIHEYQKTSDSGYLTDVQKAVYDICRKDFEKEGELNLLPGVMNIYVKDGADRIHNLDSVQYVEYQTDYLRLYWEMVEETLGEAQTQEARVAVLNAAKKVAKEQATNRTLARIGANLTSYYDDFRGVDDEDVVRFKAALELAGLDGHLFQEEVEAEIRKMKDEQKIIDGAMAYMLFHSEYESDKNNPWRRYKPDWVE